MMGTSSTVVSAKALGAIATLRGCSAWDRSRIGWRLYALASTVLGSNAAGRPVQQVPVEGASE